MNESLIGLTRFYEKSRFSHRMEGDDGDTWPLI